MSIFNIYLMRGRNIKVISLLSNLVKQMNQNSFYASCLRFYRYISANLLALISIEKIDFLLCLSNYSCHDYTVWTEYMEISAN